jgi:chromosome segregation ATPase
MTSRLAFDEAVQRLNSALDAFETAVARRRANEDVIRDLEEDAHLLALDRSRLARELDEIKARATDLSTVNAEVGRRLDSAIATVRGVLSAHGG